MRRYKGDICMAFQFQKGTTTGIFAAGVLGLALLGAGAPRTWADDDTPAAQKRASQQSAALDVELNESTLQSAINLIEKQLKVSFVFDGGDRSHYGKVS